MGTVRSWGQNCEIPCPNHENIMTSLVQSSKTQVSIFKLIEIVQFPGHLGSTSPVGLDNFQLIKPVNCQLDSNLADFEKCTRVEALLVSIAYSPSDTFFWHENCNGFCMIYA